MLLSINLSHIDFFIWERQEMNLGRPGGKRKHNLCAMLSLHNFWNCLCDLVLLEQMFKENLKSTKLTL